MKSLSGCRVYSPRRLTGSMIAVVRTAVPMLLFGCGIASAADSIVPDDATHGAVGSFASLLIPLALLVAAGVGATWFVTRSRVSLMKRGGPIRLVHIAGIGPRERLVVVEVDGRRYLIGVTPNQISTLADLGDSRLGDDSMNSVSRSMSQP